MEHPGACSLSACINCPAPSARNPHYRMTFSNTFRAHFILRCLYDVRYAKSKSSEERLTLVLMFSSWSLKALKHNIESYIKQSYFRFRNSVQIELEIKLKIRLFKLILTLFWYRKRLYTRCQTVLPFNRGLLFSYNYLFHLMKEGWNIYFVLCGVYIKNSNEKKKQNA